MVKILSLPLNDILILIFVDVYKKQNSSMFYNLKAKVINNLFDKATIGTKCKV